jgi:integrase/recombinase XerC
MNTEVVPARPELPAIGTTDDMLEAWLSGRNARTLRAYSFDAQDFARFIQAPNPAAGTDALMAGGPAMANRLALAYQADMLERRKLASSTIARCLAAPRSLVKLARQLGRVTWSIDEELPKVQRRHDTNGPCHRGWQKIRAKAAVPTKYDREGKVAKRNTALTRLMHDLALGRREAVAMDLADVDLSAGENGCGEIRIIGKGRTENETMTIGSEPARRALAEWIAAFCNVPGPVFVRMDRAANGNGLERLTGDSVNRIVGHPSPRAGLAKKARAHGLGHQGITRALELTGGDVRKVMKLSGKLDPITVMLYEDNRRDDAASSHAC